MARATKRPDGRARVGPMARAATSQSDLQVTVAQIRAARAAVDAAVQGAKRRTWPEMNSVTYRRPSGPIAAPSGSLWRKPRANTDTRAR